MKKMKLIHRIAPVSVIEKYGGFAKEAISGKQQSEIEAKVRDALSAQRKGEYLFRKRQSYTIYVNI